MALKFEQLFTRVRVPNCGILLFACRDYMVVTRVRPVEGLEDLRFGLDGKSALDLNGLKPLLIQPLNRPDAEGSILAHTSEFVAHNVAELH